jgi:drug/metabolite transporter (DMT)-like permease
VSRVLAAVHGLSGNQRGMALMFLAMIGSAISQGMVRQVSAELHTFEIVFLTTLIGLPVLLPWFVRHGLEPFRDGACLAEFVIFPDRAVFVIVLPEVHIA